MVFDKLLNWPSSQFRQVTGRFPLAEEAGGTECKFIVFSSF